MTTLYALMIIFSNGNGASGQIIAFSGSNGREYGLYETLGECKVAAAKSKEIQVEMADRYFHVTCVPVIRN